MQFEENWPHLVAAAAGAFDYELEAERLRTIADSVPSPELDAIVTSEGTIQSWWQS